MVSQLTVILKDSERSYRHKFLPYEDFRMSEEDPVIQKCIQESKENFDGEPEEITIKVSMEIK